MIVYSAFPHNNIFPSSTPEFQDWGPKTDAQNFYIFKIDYAPVSGMPAPTPSVTFTIPDVIGNPLYAQYSEFKLRTVGHFPNGTTHFLTPECVAAISSGYSGSLTIPITTNGISYVFEPELINLNLLNFEEHWYVIDRYLQGKNASGNWENISFYYCIVKLYILPNIVFYSPNRLNFQHILGFTPQTKSFSIYGNSWKIVGNPMFTIDSPTSGVTITEVLVNNNGYENQIQTLIGSGEALIEVTPNDFFDTVDPLDILVRTFSIFTIGPDFFAFDGFIYNQVEIFTDEILISEPRELYFIGSKGFAEPLPQYIFYKCTNATYTIVSSPWIVTTDVVINVNGIDRTAIEVKMIPNSNLAVGLYDGFVQITSVIKGDTETQVTKVFYDLSDFVKLPYKSSKKAFTLDKKFVNFSTINLNTYIQFNITAKVYDFFTNIETIITIPQKIALFKGAAEINVGRTIHRIMKRFETLTAQEYQYKYAQVVFNCEERNYADNTPVRQVQSDTIIFVAGLSYANKDMTILDINLKPNRVTTESYVYLNLLLLSPGSSIEVLRNGNAYDLITLPFSTDTILTKKLFFSDFAQGDVISCRVINTLQNRTTIPPNTSQSMVKEFKVFPLNEFSNQIIWQNEYLLKSTIDCTGSYKIQTDIEFQSQKLFHQLVEVLEILDSSKTVKLTINTGWLLKTDIDTVESLMRSPRVWLEQGSSTIDLRPSGKSIINDDSERERIEFTLEFEINKKYNEETYSL